MARKPRLSPAAVEAHRTGVPIYDVPRACELCDSNNVTKLDKLTPSGCHFQVKCNDCGRVGYGRTPVGCEIGE